LERDSFGARARELAASKPGKRHDGSPVHATPEP